jgi:hypothetical protein
MSTTIPPTHAWQRELTRGQETDSGIAEVDGDGLLEPHDLWRRVSTGHARHDGVAVLLDGLQVGSLVDARVASGNCKNAHHK